MGTCSSSSDRYAADDADAEGAVDGALVEAGGGTPARWLDAPHGGEPVTSIASCAAAGCGGGGGGGGGGHGSGHGSRLGRCFVTSSQDGTLALCDWQGLCGGGGGGGRRGVVVRRYAGHTGSVSAVAVGRRVLASASRDLTVRLWPLPLGDEGEGEGGGEGGTAAAGTAAQPATSSVLSGHELSVTALTFLGGSGGGGHPQEQQPLLITGARDCTVRAWDVETGAQTACARVPRNLVTCLAALGGASPSVFAQGSEDLTLRLWDLRVAGGLGGAGLAQPSASFGGYVYFPLCVAASADGRQLLTGSKGFGGGGAAGCELRLWDVRQPAAPLLTLGGHAQDVTGCAFLPQGGGAAARQQLASVSKDGSVRIWDGTTGACECVHTELDHGGGICCFTGLAAAAGAGEEASSADGGGGASLYASSYAGSVFVYGLEGGGGGGGGGGDEGGEREGARLRRLARTRGAEQGGEQGGDL
jgi:WD40 repeat protein